MRSNDIGMRLKQLVEYTGHNCIFEVAQSGDAQMLKSLLNEGRFDRDDIEYIADRLMQYGDATESMDFCHKHGLPVSRILSDSVMCGYIQEAIDFCRRRNDDVPKYDGIYVETVLSAILRKGFTEDFGVAEFRELLQDLLLDDRVLSDFVIYIPLNVNLEVVKVLFEDSKVFWESKLLFVNSYINPVAVSHVPLLKVVLSDKRMLAVLSDDNGWRYKDLAGRSVISGSSELTQIFLDLRQTNIAIQTVTIKDIYDYAYSFRKSIDDDSFPEWDAAEYRMYSMLKLCNFNLLLRAMPDTDRENTLASGNVIIQEMFKAENRWMDAGHKGTELPLLAQKFVQAIDCRLICKNLFTMFPQLTRDCIGKIFSFYFGVDTGDALLLVNSLSFGHEPVTSTTKCAIIVERLCLGVERLNLDSANYKHGTMEKSGNARQ